MNQKKKTQYPGVRYRESVNRPKYNGKPDKYYSIRYTNGKNKKIEEGVGWASEGISAAIARDFRAKIIIGIKSGEGPVSLADMRCKTTPEQKDGGQEANNPSDLILDDLADEYLAWARMNKKSWMDDYYRFRHHIQPVLGRKTLRDISASDLEKIKNSLMVQKLSAATIRHCLALIRQILNKAKAWRDFDGPDIFKKIKMPRIDNRRVRFLNREEATKLLDELQKHSPRTYRQAVLSLYAGLRWGEITGLKWSDINWENGIIFIMDPKSGRRREAYINDPIRKVLETCKELRELKPDSPFVFPNNAGGRQSKIYDIFPQTVAGMGLNTGITDPRHKVVFHTLRHTFASWLVLNGVPLYTVKELLGHRSMTMTERYAHLSADIKRQAVEGL